MILRHGLVFACVWLYLLAWSLLTPPLLAPDEPTHLVKTLSLPSNPWFTPSPRVEVRNDLVNPLLSSPHVREVAGRPWRTVSLREISDMKRGAWSPDPEGTTRLWTAAHIYPWLYYGVLLVLGQGTTALLSLSPYASLYAFRAASALLAAALWTAVFARLGVLGRPRTELFALLLLIPMVAILGSSINPDAVFVPLCTLAMLASYEAIFRGRALRGAALLLLALAFTKSAAALLAFPTLAALVAAAWLGGRLRGGVRIHWRNAAVLIGGVLVVYYGTFYHWSPAYPSEIFPDKFHKELVDYLLEVGAHGTILFASFWLALGLPDTLAPGFVYGWLLVVLALNAAVFAWTFRGLEEKGRYGFLIGFALLYGAALLAGEYVNFPKTGYLLQGRYFLPVALGLLLLTCHPVRSLRRALLVTLAGFNPLRSAARHGALLRRRLEPGLEGASVRGSTCARSRPDGEPRPLLPPSLQQHDLRHEQRSSKACRAASGSRGGAAVPRRPRRNPASARANAAPRARRVLTSAPRRSGARRRRPQRPPPHARGIEHPTVLPPHAGHGGGEELARRCPWRRAAAPPDGRRRRGAQKSLGFR